MAGRTEVRRDSNVTLLLSALTTLGAFVLMPYVPVATGVFAVAALVLLIALFVRFIA